MPQKRVKEILKSLALEMGFNDLAFISTRPLQSSEERFLRWREQGFAANMNYLLRENPVNARPENLLDGAKTILVFTVNYYTPAPPRPGNDYGRVASYAVGLDYHKVIRKKLKLFSQKAQEKVLSETGKKIFNSSKVFSDAVPLLEKSFAREAGLGFKGNNSLLISKEQGSFNFIAEIITDVEIEPDYPQSPTENKLELTHSNPNPHIGTCGACTRCIDICPTKALVEISPREGGSTKSINKDVSGAYYGLDSRLCISYQNIENREVIPEDLRAGMGEWLFGCDLCQSICPYNRKLGETEFSTEKQKITYEDSLTTSWDEFKPESGAGHWIYLPDILSIESEEEFHEKFCRTAITRAKRTGLIRNAMIVAANSKSEASLPYIEKYLNNKNRILIETAGWALRAYERQFV